jgi:hypothetical protein
MSTTDYHENTETQPSPTPAPEQIESLLSPLAQTKPWVLLCAIIGIVSAGFIILAGIFMLVGFSTFMATEMGSSGAIAAVSVLYVIMGVVAIIPPYWLLKYSGAIKQAIRSQDLRDVALALNYQKSFWKFVGILMAIYVALMLLSLVLAVLGGLASYL